MKRALLLAAVVLASCGSSDLPGDNPHMEPQTEAATHCSLTPKNIEHFRKGEFLEPCQVPSYAAPIPKTWLPKSPNGYWTGCKGDPNPNCHEFVGFTSKLSTYNSLRKSSDSEAYSCPASVFGHAVTVLDWVDTRFTRQEIADFQYDKLAQLVRCKPDLKPAVVAAFKDGTVTVDEFNDLVLKETERDTTVDQQKARDRLRKVLSE